MMTVIRCTEQVPVFANPWVEVYFDHVEASRPDIRRYTRIVEAGGRCGVVVLPLHDDNIGMVEVFRYPIGKTVWELPRGFGDTDDPVIDAQREIEEETTLRKGGYVLHRLGAVHANSGLVTNQAMLFAAVCSEEFPSGKPKDPEVESFEWFSSHKVADMIRSGVLTDGFTFAALLRATQEGLIELPA